MERPWIDRERFAVWGLGRSGRAAANLLARRGKQVVASDIRSDEDLSDDVAKLHDAVQWVGGENVIGDAQLIVTSPGLRPGLPIFEKARHRGIPVISEVELAWEVSPSSWVGITGTDGKTTTTSLTGAMLEASGINCVVAGNIGIALCDVVDEIGEEGVIVAELSANQLWSCHRLRVDVAAITNIAEDHLDYFDDFSEYPRAKHRLVRLQGPDGATVLPAGDLNLLDDLDGDLCGALTLFGPGAQKCCDDVDAVFFDDDRRGRFRIGARMGTWLEDFDEVSLLGEHNRWNAACAAAICHRIGACWEGMEQGLMGFSALPHRMEPVATIDGVDYIDDSKATNAHASLAGLQGVKGPMIVIAGGRDKGLDLDAWAQTVAHKAQSVLLIGEITERMTQLLEQQGGEVHSVQTLEGAVDQAQEIARPGSTVVLSPACSSYDMFSSYKDRGRRFQQAVRRLTQ